MKLNFEVEDEGVKIYIDPRIHSKEVLMRTAYKFIDRAWISVERANKSDKVLLSILPRDPDKRNEEDLEKIALRFNTDLITSFVEDAEAKRYAKARNAMIEAAMFSQYPPKRSNKSKGEKTY